MRHKSIILMALFALLQLCTGLWAQPMTEDEGEAKWQSHFPEDSESYMPVPMPKPRNSIGIMSASFKNKLVSYDAITGEEFIWEIDYEDMPLEAWSEGSDGMGAETLGGTITLLNFTDLMRIGNPKAFPWRVNCKLFFKQGSFFCAGSGILIDPLHVLTAGHCIHEGNRGNWSTDMVVVPGYENGSRPFGDALGINYYCPLGWTQSGNYNYDIGVIELDRPIGALTGWVGYGYSENSSFYTNNTFHNAGYPAEDPYNGQDMYDWYGNFDSTGYSLSLGAWISNQLTINKRAYRGMSGSGIYFDDGSSRYAVAVISNGTDLVTNCPRVNKTLFQDIGAFIGVNTPSNYDLWPLNVSLSQDSIRAGSQLSSMSYVVHNNSSASWSGTVYVDVYLSTNNNISTSDTLIDSHSFQGNFRPKSATRVNVTTPPVIPTRIPATIDGNYWIGVILNISDQNTGNNDSDGQEAAQIRVY
jgi:V8-like Glu-specific endopeptidase